MVGVHEYWFMRERLKEGEGLRTSAPMIMKKPKTEEDSGTALSLPSSGPAEVNRTESSRQEQEEALVALIEHRTFEVQHLRQRISYYTSQLEEAEKRLHDSESKLSRLRGHGDAVSSKSSSETVAKNVKVECGSTIPTLTNEGSAVKALRSNVKASPSHSNQNKSSPVHARDNSNGTLTKREETEIRDKGTKRKFEHKEHEDLISLIRSSSSPLMIHGNSGNYISSQHRRKLRNLAFCPVNDQLFVTSALDGLINLWQVHSKGSGISLLSSTDCVSPKERRWPEDVAWHPEGNSLFSVYSADGGDSQISILNLHKTIDKGRVTYLEGKPHVKGVINSIKFLPSENTSFVTGGSDHAVILWNERDAENTWKPQALHRNLHSSAVMGVAGMEQKHIVLSAGADKRIFGFDVKAGKVGFKHQIESKCMSVLPNPCDFNLFMVQTGTPEKQLRLFDSRQQAEIHAFGWKQESSESQSALINQAWSPDGLFLTSGSADPVIHVFDIRKDFQRYSIVSIIKYAELILMGSKIAILSRQRKPVTRYHSLLLRNLTEV